MGFQLGFEFCLGRVRGIGIYEIVICFLNEYYAFIFYI